MVWNIFHILGIIVPTDFYIFQRGGSTTNQISKIKKAHHQWCREIRRKQLKRRSKHMSVSINSKRNQNHDWLKGKNLETIDFAIKYGVFPYNIYIYTIQTDDSSYFLEGYGSSTNQMIPFHPAVPDGFWRNQEFSREKWGPKNDVWRCRVVRVYWTSMFFRWFVWILNWKMMSESSSSHGSSPVFSWSCV